MPATPGNGVIVVDGPDIRVITLQDGATATSNGFWVNLGRYRGAIDIHVQGITTATVQIFGDNTSGATSNNTTVPPGNATDFTQIGSNITADAHLTLTGGPLWIKAKVSANQGFLMGAELVRTA